MRAGRKKPFGPSTNGAGDRLLRDEIEADVLELWIGVSRLMARLNEPDRPFASVRRATRSRQSSSGRSAPSGRLRHNPS
jgi:hypothetical protein